MVELVDEADLGATERRAAVVGERRSGLTADKNLAGIGRFEKAGDVEERRLACPGGRDERNKFARPERKVGVLQHRQRAGAGPIGAGDAVQGKRAFLWSLGRFVGSDGRRRFARVSQLAAHS
jgi:hypothetical protein